MSPWQTRRRPLAPLNDTLALCTERQILFGASSCHDLALSKMRQPIHVKFNVHTDIAIFLGAKRPHVIRQQISLRPPRERIFRYTAKPAAHPRRLQQNRLTASKV